MSAGSGKTSLSSGQVAARCGVSPDTLRHYERLGLLPPPGRTAAGYRLYPPDTCDRVRVIRAALAVGFTLVELAAVFRMRARGEAPCRGVLGLARARLDEVDARLAQLRSLRERLAAVVSEWEARLGTVPRGVRAQLLEQLAEDADPGGASPHLSVGLARNRRRKERRTRP